MTASTAFRFGLTLPMAALLLQAAGPSEKPYRYNGSAYITAAFGACQHGVPNIGAAGGGEGFLWRGLTLGGEIGAYRFVERSGGAFGITTLNIGYSFADRNRRGRLEPFVNAGVLGMAFGPGTAHAGGFGGGLNYWFHPKFGLRTEGRAMGLPGEALVMFRVGVSFR